MSLTKVTYSMIQGDYISVLDYMSAAQVADVLSPTGGTIDVTAAVQAAIDASWGSNIGNNNVVFFPAGRYLITDTINLHAGSKLMGANIDYGGTAGAQSFPNKLSDSKGTVLIFAPTTQKSLFAPSLPKGGSSAWSAISIRGLNIWGNTSLDDYHKTLFGDASPVVENSLYAIDFKEVQFSEVENVAITGFMAGVREGSRCQSNVFTKLYIARCRQAAVLYSINDINVEATDTVWRDCTFWTHKHFVQVEDGLSSNDGDVLQIRFDSCVFKGSASHGFLLSRKSKDWAFTNCFGETIALDTGVADRSCFFVGVGAGGSGSNYNGVNLSVIGGQWAGASSPGGTFVKADYCGGINLIGCTAKRFAVGISATANTRDKSIYMSNPLFNTVTTLFSGTTDILWGNYRTVDITGGSDVAVVRTNYVIADGELELSGATIRIGDGSSTSARPGGDDTMSLGRADFLWSEVFAASGTINTSDERSKQDIANLDDAEKRVAVAVKGLIKKFRYKSAVERKGDDARIHIGVIAQDVKAAFETEGLDAHRYGILCYDEWEDDDGVKHDRYGVRYDELLAFVISSI
jgi:hypothetical protein